MVAITTTQPLARPWPSRPSARCQPRHLELVREPAVARPSLSRATYRRRRFAVAAVAAALITACIVVAVLVQSGGNAGSTLVRTSDGSAAVASRPVVLYDLAGYGAGRAPLPQGATYVVRPGDTLWSIAALIDPDHDVREVVDELADLNGGPVLQAGQVIRLR